MFSIKEWFHQLVTEPDNKTHCPVRWIAILGTLQGLATHAWSVFVQHAPFSLQEFGVGLGAIMATVGAALGLKKDSPSNGGDK